MKKLAALLATCLMLMAVPVAASAQTDDAPTLADILLADSAEDVDGFDYNPLDYDIVTQAVLAFPDLTAAAADPNAELTVFLPTDWAFARLARELGARGVWAEEDVFNWLVENVGLDTIETVLKYHIVPGAKIPFDAALDANGAELPTLLGEDATLTVKARTFGKWRHQTRRFGSVTLIDADTDDRDARVWFPDVGGEASNGYAHGINRVLRPIDLP